MEPSQLDLDLSKLKEGLGSLPEAMVNPGFVVVSGLPGTGKTHLSNRLAEKLHLAVIESDALRKALFPEPIGPEIIECLFSKKD